MNFDKIHALIPGFKCQRDVTTGARELLEIFQRIDMSPEIFEFRAYTRLKQLQYLLRTGQIDKDFYWSLRGTAKAEDRRGVSASLTLTV